MIDLFRGVLFSKRFVDYSSRSKEEKEKQLRKVSALNLSQGMGREGVASRETSSIAGPSTSEEGTISQDLAAATISTSAADEKTRKGRELAALLFGNDGKKTPLQTAATTTSAKEDDEKTRKERELAALLFEDDEKDAADPAWEVDEQDRGGFVKNGKGKKKRIN